MNSLNLAIIHLSNHMDGHDHNYGQMLMPLKGVIFLGTDKGAYTLDNRTLSIIPPEVTHHYNGSEDNEVLILNFSKHTLKKEDAALLKDVQFHFLSEKMAHVKALLRAEVDKPTSAFAVKYLFFYLYDLLLGKPQMASIDYISKNYDEAIEIKTLAAIEHYSENYYREWFKKKTGLSPMAYIQRFRVEKAKELLLSTNYTVSDIAYQVGFAHNSSFTRAFKTLEEEDPRNYRKKNGHL